MVFCGVYNNDAFPSCEEQPESHPPHHPQEQQIPCSGGNGDVEELNLQTAWRSLLGTTTDNKNDGSTLLRDGGCSVIAPRESERQDHNSNSSNNSKIDNDPMKQQQQQQEHARDTSYFSSSVPDVMEVSEGSSTTNGSGSTASATGTNRVQPSTSNPNSISNSSNTNSMSNSNNSFMPSSDQSRKVPRLHENHHSPKRDDEDCVLARRKSWNLLDQDLEVVHYDLDFGSSTNVLQQGLGDDAHFSTQQRQQQDTLTTTNTLALLPENSDPLLTPRSSSLLHRKRLASALSSWRKSKDPTDRPLTEVQEDCMRQQQQQQQQQQVSGSKSIDDSIYEILQQGLALSAAKSGSPIPVSGLPMTASSFLSQIATLPRQQGVPPGPGSDVVSSVGVMETASSLSSPGKMNFTLRNRMRQLRLQRKSKQEQQQPPSQQKDDYVVHSGTAMLPRNSITDNMDSDEEEEEGDDYYYDFDHNYGHVDEYVERVVTPGVYSRYESHPPPSPQGASGERSDDSEMSKTCSSTSDLDLERLTLHDSKAATTTTTAIAVSSQLVPAIPSMGMTPTSNMKPHMKRSITTRGESLYSMDPMNKDATTSSNTVLRLDRKSQYNKAGVITTSNGKNTSKPISNTIKLHIYDLIAADTLMLLPWGCVCEIGKCFNEVNSALHELGTGAYHVGIEVNGVEYAYGATSTKGRSGVFSCIPKLSPGYQYRTTIDFGARTLIRKQWVAVLKNGKKGSLTIAARHRKNAHQNNRYVDYKEIEECIDGRQVIKEMSSEYMGSDYDILRKNCCTFARDACVRLGVPEAEIPKWFRNLAENSAMTHDMALATLTPISKVFSVSDEDPSAASPKKRNSRSSSVASAVEATSLINKSSCRSGAASGEMTCDEDDAFELIAQRNESDTRDIVVVVNANPNMCSHNAQAHQHSVVVGPQMVVRRTATWTY